MRLGGAQKRDQEKTVLFVCVENAGRSQMAEGFFNARYAPKGFRALSAGTRQSSGLNPLAVQAMLEAGIDISGQKSKEVTDEMIRQSSRTVNMGCMDQSECPMLFINDVIDWGIEDPKGKTIDKVRQIRDEIERRVKEIASALESPQS